LFRTTSERNVNLKKSVRQKVRRNHISSTGGRGKGKRPERESHLQLVKEARGLLTPKKGLKRASWLKRKKGAGGRKVKYFEKVVRSGPGERAAGKKCCQMSLQNFE